MLREELRFFPEQTPWARQGEEIPKRANAGKLRELTPAWAPALFFILFYPPKKALWGLVFCCVIVSVLCPPGKGS